MGSSIKNGEGHGNKFDNIILGNSHGNTLEGGKGNDTLIGGAGSDTYLFGKGDGQDVIRDYNGGVTSTSSNSDTLKFTDFNQNNLWLTHTGDDLIIDRLGSVDQVRIVDWFFDATGFNQVENIKTADGKTLLNTDINKLVEVMAGFSTPPASTTWYTTANKNGQVLGSPQR